MAAGKVLMIAADERHSANCQWPPVLHRQPSGGDPAADTTSTRPASASIATLSGNPAKFEWWAFPNEDRNRRAVRALCLVPASRCHWTRWLPARCGFGLCCSVIPGGHGALIGLPQSRGAKSRPALGDVPATPHHHPLPRSGRTAGCGRGRGRWRFAVPRLPHLRLP